MANRTFFSPVKTLQRAPVRLYCKFTAKDDGACTLADAPFNEGITSVAESGTGEYKITLADKYSYLAGVTIMQDDTNNAAHVSLPIVVSANTNVQAATPIVSIKTNAMIGVNNLVLVTLDLFNSID